MLQSICEHLHNFFIRSAYPGEYRIENGAISPCPSLKNGQRFWIVGSDLNDGVYTYGAQIMNDDNTQQAALQDEAFSGTILTMAVPKAVLDLAGEIADWVQANSAALNSPYTSESFGGYSYTKATGNANSGDSTVTWQSMFRSKLDPYRKIQVNLS